MTTPKISFLCPSYNHERYMAQFIRSVLAQTLSEWELIIVDDFSTDGNVGVAREFEDERIRLITRNRNKGINAGLNDAYSAARAPVVAFIASDDELLPEYAEVICRTFSELPDVGYIYTPLLLMDQNGRDMEGVLQKCRDVKCEEYFSTLFLHENFLQSPGMAVRRDWAERIFPLPLGLLQYQDVAMGLALAFFTRAYHLSEPLVRYRFSEKGVSWCNSMQLTQRFGETAAFMDMAVSLVGNDVRKFNEHFSKFDELRNVKVTSKTVPFWMARLALTSSLPARRVWGLQKIVSLMNLPEVTDELYRECGMEFRDVNSVVRSCMPVSYEDVHEERKIKKIFPGIYKVRESGRKIISIAGLKIIYSDKGHHN